MAQSQVEKGLEYGGGKREWTDSDDSDSSYENSNSDAEMPACKQKQFDVAEIPARKNELKRPCYDDISDDESGLIPGGGDEMSDPYGNSDDETTACKQKQFDDAEIPACKRKRSGEDESKKPLDDEEPAQKPGKWGLINFVSHPHAERISGSKNGDKKPENNEEPEPPLTSAPVRDRVMDYITNRDEKSEFAGSDSLSDDEQPAKGEKLIAVSDYSSNDESYVKPAKKKKRASVRRISKKKISNYHDKIKWKTIKTFMWQTNNDEYRDMTSTMDRVLRKLGRKGLLKQNEAPKGRSKSKTQFDTLFEWIEDKLGNKNWSTSIAAMYRRQGHPIMDDIVSLILLRHFDFLTPGVKTTKSKSILMDGIHHPSGPAPEKWWKKFLEVRTDKGSKNGREVFSIFYEYKTRYVAAGLLCPFGLTADLEITKSMRDFLKKCDHSVLGLLKIEEQMMSDLIKKKGGEQTAMERDSVRVIASFEAFVRAIREQYGITDSTIVEMMSFLRILPDLKDDGQWMISPTVSRYEPVDYVSCEGVFSKKKIAKFTVPRIEYDIGINLPSDDDKVYSIYVWRNGKKHIVEVEI